MRAVGVNDGPWFDNHSAEYWKRAQHTSALLQILPHLEQGPLYDQLPSISVNISNLYGIERDQNLTLPEWIGDHPGVHAALFQKMDFFYCPSDSLETVEPDAVAIITSQPCYALRSKEDMFLGQPWYDTLQNPAGTNYLGCAGAHSGGNQPDLELAPFTGYMSCRDRKSIVSVRDGSSHTIMYGENIGYIHDSRRLHYFSWVMGGLARGRGILPWKQNIRETMPDYLLLGDSQYAYIAGFGSKHPTVVNFAFGDGSTKSIDRMIRIETFYALCGGEDGQ
jgi:hypothetical protein